MPKNPNDYTSRGWQVACTSLLLLAVISFIPPITVGGVKLRRASILSDVIDHSDGQEQHSTELVELPEIDVKEFEVDLIEVAQKVAETTASASPLGEATSASWEGNGKERYIKDHATSRCPLWRIVHWPTTRIFCLPTSL